MTVKKSRKSNKSVTTPRDYMNLIPVFKFPPIATKDYMVVYRADDETLFAEPVDFVAVCEWSSDDVGGDDPRAVEVFEGICFIVLDSEGWGAFDIIYPDNISAVSNRLAVVRSDTLYWYDDKAQKQKPIYKWDHVRQTHVHLIEGELPQK